MIKIILFILNLFLSPNQLKKLVKSQMGLFSNNKLYQIMVESLHSPKDKANLCLFLWRSSPYEPERGLWRDMYYQYILSIPEYVEFRQNEPIVPISIPKNTVLHSKAPKPMTLFPPPPIPVTA